MNYHRKSRNKENTQGISWQTQRRISQNWQYYQEDQEESLLAKDEWRHRELCQDMHHLPEEKNRKGPSSTHTDHPRAKTIQTHWNRYHGTITNNYQRKKIYCISHWFIYQVDRSQNYRGGRCPNHQHIHLWRYYLPTWNPTSDNQWLRNGIC